jgi:isoquinoline 1-oxidoreductase beta subunit
MRGVLDRAAAMAKWGRKLPPRSGLGIAFHFSHLGYFANVVEASVAKDGGVRVKKVWVAGDVGRQIVNPSGALQQVQGSVLDALGAALNQRITFADGAVEQRNFGDYPILRMAEAPPVEVQFVLSDNNPTGLGEPGYPALAPALGNAIFAATGVRLRSLPFDVAALKA